jgi:RNA polymerase sigma-70 factor, ECF subfamily
MDELTRLFLRGRDGDRMSMHDFLQRTQSDVWRFCAAFLGPQDADDATQDTFVRAWRSAETFRAEASAKTWLLSIARRSCYELSRKRHQLPVPSLGALDRRSDDQTHVVDLDDLIARLSDERRTALVLTQVLGLPYEEAAAICDCPVGTIRSRVARARADLLRLGREVPDERDQRGLI